MVFCFDRFSDSFLLLLSFKIVVFFPSIRTILYCSSTLVLSLSLAFVVSIFRTFFKRNASFVRSFALFVHIYLLLLGFIRSIQTTILCVCVFLCYLLFNYYYFIKVLYYLCSDTHAEHDFLAECEHTWGIKSKGDEKNVRKKR